MSGTSRLWRTGSTSGSDCEAEMICCAPLSGSTRHRR
jgi:hypothetical protein